MERVGIFASHGLPVTESVVAGVRHLDCEPIELYDAVWTAAGTRRDLESVVVVGSGIKSDEIVDFWAKLIGVPVVRVLPCYVPEDGRWFVGSSDPSWLPEEIAAAERLAEAGVAVQEKRRVKAQSILVLGQAGGYGRFRRDIEEWAMSALDRLRALSDNQIGWRPDPREPFTIASYDHNSMPAAEDLSEALDAAWLAVTNGSPYALDALIAGMPVIYDSDTPSVYSAVCEPFQRFGSIKPPAKALVERMLRGILAAQVTAEDIATGEPLARAFDPETRLSLEAVAEEEGAAPKKGKGQKGQESKEPPEGAA